MSLYKLPWSGTMGSCALCGGKVEDVPYREPTTVVPKLPALDPLPASKEKEPAWYVTLFRVAVSGMVVGAGLWVGGHGFSHTPWSPSTMYFGVGLFALSTVLPFLYTIVYRFPFAFGKLIRGDQLHMDGGEYWGLGLGVMLLVVLALGLVGLIGYEFCCGMSLLGEFISHLV